MEHSTIICYAACVDDIEHVQMRSVTQYNTNLCKLGEEHSKIFICYATSADEVDSRSGTQCGTLNYHGNQDFQVNN